MGHEVITDFNVFRDIQTLAGQEVRDWRNIDRRIREGGDLTALGGPFTGLTAAPLATAGATVTLSASWQAWWSGLLTPLNTGAYTLQAPSSFLLKAAGTMSTTTTSLTTTVTPYVSTTATGNTATMGASSALALTSTFTNGFWQLEGDITVRSIGGPPGTANSTAYGTFNIMWTTAAGPATASSALFGFTAASFDASVPQYLTVGSLASTASDVTVTPQQVYFASWT